MYFINFQLVNLVRQAEALKHIQQIFQTLKGKNEEKGTILYRNF